MDGNNGACARSDGRLHRLGIQIESLQVDIREDWNCVRFHDRRRRGQESVGRNDNFVVRLNARRHQTDAQGNRRAVSGTPFPNNTIPQSRFNPTTASRPDAPTCHCAACEQPFSSGVQDGPRRKGRFRKGLEQRGFVAMLNLFCRDTELRSRMGPVQLNRTFTREAPM